MTDSPTHFHFFKQKLPHWQAYTQRLALNPVSHARPLPRVPADNARCVRARKQAAASQHALGLALAELKGVVEFCEPLLQAELTRRLSEVLEPRHDEIVLITRQVASLGPLHEISVERHTLLMAALQNFASGENFSDDCALAPPGAFVIQGPTGQLPGRTFSYTRKHSTTAVDFAQLCRSLDLGARYQSHLDSVFESGPGAGTVHGACLEADRDRLLLDLEQAAAEGMVTGLPLAEVRKIAKGQASSWGCSQLILMDAALADAVLFSAPSRDAVARCVVWLPGASQSVLREYASTADFVVHLTTLMGNDGFRASLTRQVSQSQRDDFTTRLAAQLELAHPRLWVTEVVYAGELLEHRYQLYKQRLRDEARALAVPVADVDTAARLQAAERYAGWGLNVLNLAGLFVPALNTVLLAVASAQLMDEVFTGIQAWEQDDSQAALAHFEAIAANVAFMAVAGAVAANAPAIEPSPLIERLAPVTLENGERRLWQPDLHDYVSDAVLDAQHQPDGYGQLFQDGRNYVRLDGQLYEQAPSPEGWRLEHPHRSDAYRPLLAHNGEGAWRQLHEPVHTWSSAQLMRRLGHRVDGLTSEQLEQVRLASGISDEALRGLHAGSRRIPALLEHVLAQFHGAQASATAYARHAPVLDGPARLLTRDFPSLTPAAANEIGAAATDGERDFMAVQQRIPLRLGEVARLYQRDLRLNSAQVGLFVPALSTQDSDRLLFAMLAHQPGWTGQVALQLRLEHRTGALLAQLGGPDATEVKTIVRQAQGYQPYDAQGLELRRTDTLAGALLAALPDSERTALNYSVHDAERLHVDLRTQVLADRSRAGQALGYSTPLPWFRLPVRQPSGLLGYAMSGRLARWLGWGSAARLRNLYPRLPKAEFRQLEESLGQGLELAVTGLEEEYRVLVHSLDEWVDSPGVCTDAQGVTQVVSVDSRREFARRLTAAWRRESPEGARGYEQHGRLLTFEDLRVGRLPVLTANLKHVWYLTMDDMGVELDPSDFLGVFTGLRELNLRRNRLQALPAALSGMPNLRRLTLQGNRLRWGLDLLAPLREGNVNMLILSQNPLQTGAYAMAQLSEMTQLRQLSLDHTGITLSAADCESLARLTQLQHLTLSRNAITLDAQGAAALASLTRLQALDLSNNPLGVLPDISGMSQLRTLRLSHTGVEQWPPGLNALMSQGNTLSTVLLDGNPIAQVPSLEGLAFAQARRLAPRDYLLQIDDTALTPQSLAHLRAIGVRPSNLDPLPDWMGGCPVEVEQWVTELRQDPRARGFFAVLDKAASSKDYQLAPDAMKQRLWAVVRAVSEQPPERMAGVGLSDLREQMFLLAEEAEATCGDAIALAFNRFETLLLVFDAVAQVNHETGQVQALLTLSRQLHRASLLDDCCVAIAQARMNRRAVMYPQAAAADLLRPWQPTVMIDDEAVAAAAPKLHPTDVLDDRYLVTIPDEVEIRLLLRLRLRERLDLPPQPDAALYNEWIEARMVEQVAAFVLEQATPDRLIDWLLGERYWETAMMRYQAPAFVAIDDLWNQGFVYLYELGRAEGDLEEVSAQVLAELRAVLPDKAWEVQGAAQRVALDATEQDLAASWLKAARDRATRQLLRITTERLITQGAAQ